jgi:hypothetical protein
MIAGMVHFWVPEYHELLMSDTEEQFIPRMHWNAAVHYHRVKVATNARMHVTASVIF